MSVVHDDDMMLASDGGKKVGIQFVLEIRCQGGDISCGENRGFSCGRRINVESDDLRCQTLNEKEGNIGYQARPECGRSWQD